MDSSDSLPEPTDWGTVHIDEHSELTKEADAYAATAQSGTAAASGLSQASGIYPQQQQQSDAADGSTAEAGHLMPVDELPTFELPGQAHLQLEREVAGGAAAAATMSVLQHAAAVHTASGAGDNGAEETNMQVDEPRVHQQQQQRAQAEHPMQPALAQPRSSSGAAGAGSSSAVVGAAGASSSALLLPIDEGSADALRSALQQQDDQQLMQEAAAVGETGSTGAGYAAGLVPSAADAESVGLPVPELSAGIGGQSDDTAVARLKQLQLQDRTQQQQQQQHSLQQHFPTEPTGQSGQQGWQADHLQVHWQQSQQQQQQQGHGQLDLDELLQPGPGGMDLDRDAGDIPVLEQPRQQQPWHNAADALLPPSTVKQQQQQDLDGLFAAGMSGSAKAVAAAREGLGPQDFGLPIEAPPVLPDEPVQLLQVPENPAESFLL